MSKFKIATLGLLLFSLTAFSQTYPNNEDSQYQDMLTPGYYNAPNGDDFRNEINKFIHFVRLEPFQHPLENISGQMATYTVTRGFGDELGSTGTAQHHNAYDMHIGNNETDVVMFASIDGYVTTYQDAPKYRDYLTISKNIEDSVGNIIGKMVVLYGHIDLNLDELDGRLLDGQTVNKGDTISKHLYSETLGGAHLHFEIRYYRPSDIGSEDYYGWFGGSSTYTEPSSGTLTYGFWDTNLGYGFAHPENHLNYIVTSIETSDIENYILIFPNPANDYLQINVDNENKSSLTIFDLTGKIILKKGFHKNIKLNIQDFTKGVFFIEIKTENKLITRKIIKI